MIQELEGESYSFIPKRRMEENADHQSPSAQTTDEKVHYWRNLTAFWIFGLTNNFAYVVMLSAAHDILKTETNSEHDNSTAGNTTSTTLAPSPGNSSDSDYLECNSVSTGAILLADVLPALAVKLTFPFFIQKIPYCVRISVITACTVGSFLLVAMAHEMSLSILGVVCASFGSGLGEITFLSLTTFYHRNVVSTWSSGTGGAGIVGAFAYAGLTSIGLTPRVSLFVMLAVPALLMITYIFILGKPKSRGKKDDDSDSASDTSSLLGDGRRRRSVGYLTLRQKLNIVPSLAKYMIPLLVVYFCEYLINQGLHEILYFNDVFLSKDEQYRWFQVAYQIGVFISRSSVNIIHIRKLWFLPVLQFVNMCLLLCQVFFHFIPSLWIVLLMVIWEGLLGGAAYVNTFFMMTNEIPANEREFSIGLASLGDSVGVSIAGASAIPVHNAICNMHLKMS